jgi:hypothetical protein
MHVGILLRLNTNGGFREQEQVPVCACIQHYPLLNWSRRFGAYRCQQTSYPLSCGPKSFPSHGLAYMAAIFSCVTR